MPNVAKDLQPKLIAGFGDLVYSHVVHFNGRGILSLLEINVAHIDTKTPALRVLLVLNDRTIRRKGFGVKLIRLILKPVVCQRGHKFLR